MNTTNNDEIEIDLVEIFHLLVGRMLIIIASGIMFAVITALVCKLAVKPTYTSTSKLYIMNTDNIITSISDLQVGSSLALDYVELIKGRPVVDKVISNLELDMSYDEMLGKLTLDNPESTRILKITIKDHDPRLAKEIADEFASVSIQEISSIMKTEKPSIAEHGYISQSPITPTTKKNTVIAAILGIMLACIVIIVRYILDDTIKSEEDIEKYLGLTTLSLIPLGKEEADRVKKHKKGGEK